MEVQDLSPAQCVLLTVHLASESNIKALHSFTPTRSDALDPELVLRILLTYLPEAVDPSEYSDYVGEVCSRLYLNVDREDVPVNTAPVKDLSEEQAQKRVRKLRLLKIEPPKFPPHAPRDLLTWFLCHRAYRIDSETGLLNLVPALIEPFLGRNDFIRTWYIAVVLPLLRLEIEYYPEDPSMVLPLNEFEELSGRKGIDFLMKKAAEPEKEQVEDESQSRISRDIKSLVGPWMYGHTHRKRRKLDRKNEQAPSQPFEEGLSNGVSKIGLEGVKESDKTGHDWEQMYRWMVQKSVDEFGLVASAVENWDGPSDVDLGGYDQKGLSYLDEDLQRKLELQYAQAAFASCYAAQTNDEETVRSSHNVLARLAELLDFKPPPDLATSVDSLPQIERHATKIEQSESVADLFPDALLRSEHPLTTPRVETYMLLQMMVYSAYQFSGLGHPISLVNVAKLHFYADADEQMEVLRKMLRSASKSGARKDPSQWESDHAKLLWLWNWGIKPGPNEPEEKEGAGVLGKIQKDDFEDEMLRAFVETSCYQFAIDSYVAAKPEGSEARSRVEGVILEKAMEAYDSASNGNKTRGGMKRANDILLAFRQQFSKSARFQQASALIAATHSLSFYSLKLQHGVPFQPVSIRVSKDPLSLISKLLEQNPRSYTKLDDLVDIGRNLVSAGLVSDEDDDGANREVTNAGDLSRRRKDAERRVTFMAIEAALREDDFETAYSYIVNKLSPSGADIEAPDASKQPSRKGHARLSSRARNDTEDDISWRAAFLAGRYRPSTSTPPTLRRLEQRTELLSLALLLAPASALTEILAAWRRCEEETTSLHLAQQQAEKDFDDLADKRLSANDYSALPGNFTYHDQQPDLVLNQTRREVRPRGDDDAPLSMFDLTRNAAKALSKNAFPLGEAAARSSGEHNRAMDSDDGQGSDAQGQHVRKRDMVANAASGALASGLGWVLGASPAPAPER
ncbi:unnamed protein product [Zymoseptoria tritici ST99CH_1A5]|uniref:Sec39 domain-containing protein n=1 Tax=Zymoseptoria tritici ST99CH_1A5 TaxID=1276529 RepID=A0A1Y6LAB7_ZYMTR|nr:unnamed protein product [Zymoseptoria tritici ST99CH_1A5]